MWWSQVVLLVGACRCFPAVQYDSTPFKWRHRAKSQRPGSEGLVLRCFRHPDLCCKRDPSFLVLWDKAQGIYCVRKGAFQGCRLCSFVLCSSISKDFSGSLPGICTSLGCGCTTGEKQCPVQSIIVILMSP